VVLASVESLSQAVGLEALVLGKVLVRVGVLCLWCVAVPVATLLVLRPEARSSEGLLALACWAGLIAAYTLFWFALASLVDALVLSSALGALVLVSSWVVLVLVLPVALSLGAAAASPAPSRAELATETRLITVESLTRFADQFGRDYTATSTTRSYCCPKTDASRCPSGCARFSSRAKSWTFASNVHSMPSTHSSRASRRWSIGLACCRLRSWSMRAWRRSPVTAHVGYHACATVGVRGLEREHITRIGCSRDRWQVRILDEPHSQVHG
jgi:hypothetical protein